MRTLKIRMQCVADRTGWHFTDGRAMLMLCHRLSVPVFAERRLQLSVVAVHNAGKEAAIAEE